MMEREMKTPLVPGKEVWSTPDVARIRAGEAELGANPVIAEGFFGKGS